MEIKDILHKSFNMHGFHQGCPVIDDMITQYNPDVFLLQEHWLTPANLYKFDKHTLWTISCLVVQP